MRIMGKDLLNKKYDKKKNTYWINKCKNMSSMKKQFLVYGFFLREFL